MATRKPRPSETGTMVGVRLQPDALKALDDWRAKQKDLPTRPEAVRRLITEKLKIKHQTIEDAKKIMGYSIGE